MIYNNQLSRWNSGNVTICKSRSHADMYIVEHGNGFHNLTASYDYMVQKYPPNKLVGPKSTQQIKRPEGLNPKGEKVLLISHYPPNLN